MRVKIPKRSTGETVEATLTESGRWSSDDADLARALAIRPEVVPTATHDAFVTELHEVAELFGGEVVEGEEPEPPEEGAVY